MRALADGGFVLDQRRKGTPIRGKTVGSAEG
jgi:hypothetical protein